MYVCKIYCVYICMIFFFLAKVKKANQLWIYNSCFIHYSAVISAQNNLYSHLWSHHLTKAVLYSKAICLTKFMFSDLYYVSFAYRIPSSVMFAIFIDLCLLRTIFLIHFLFPRSFCFTCVIKSREPKETEVCQCKYLLKDFCSDQDVVQLQV